MVGAWHAGEAIDAEMQHEWAEFQSDFFAYQDRACADKDGKKKRARRPGGKTTIVKE